MAASREKGTSLAKGPVGIVGMLLLELRFAEPPDTLVVSGLLRHEVDEVVEHLGMEERRRTSSGDWSAALLVRR